VKKEEKKPGGKRHQHHQKNWCPTEEEREKTKGT